MRRLHATVPCATIVVALALAGCGSTSSDSPTEAVQFQSAEIPAGHTIPATYTCDGENISPSFEWGPVPANTGELVLLVVGLRPTSIGGRYSVSVEWAVAGIAPQLHKLVAGQLPHGAYIGVASSGKRTYSICPKKGVSETYQFTLFAVPPTITISSRFLGMSALAALSTPHTSTSAIGEGSFVAHYART